MASALVQARDREGFGFDMAGVRESNINMWRYKNGVAFRVMVLLNLDRIHNSDTSEVGAYYRAEADAFSGCRLTEFDFKYGYQDLKAIARADCEMWASELGDPDTVCPIDQ